MIQCIKNLIMFLTITHNSTHAASIDDLTDESTPQLNRPTHFLSELRTQTSYVTHTNIGICCQEWHAGTWSRYSTRVPPINSDILQLIEQQMEITAQKLASTKLIGRKLSPFSGIQSLPTTPNVGIFLRAPHAPVQNNNNDEQGESGNIIDRMVDLISTERERERFDKTMRQTRYSERYK